MLFEELSNEEWSLVGPVLNAKSLAGALRRGRPRIQTRVVANAVLWVLTTGQSWSKLPARYPSQPTCRCRFEEWREEGKLTEMIRILSESGRRLLYIPDSPQPTRECEPKRHTHALDLSGSPQVVWRSQESWHGSGTNLRLSDPHFALLDDSSCACDSNSKLHVVSGDEGATRHVLPPVLCAFRQDAFWMGLVAKGDHVVDERGFVIYVAADAVPGHMFRGWAEIVRDGTRVARSGLVGSKFVAPEGAKQCALDWAHRWIEQETRREFDLLLGEPDLCCN